MPVIHFAPGFKSLCGRAAPPMAKPEAITCARCTELFRKESATGAHVWALEADRARESQNEMFAAAGVVRESEIPAAHVAQLFRVAADKREEVIRRAREVVAYEIGEQESCRQRAREIEADASARRVRNQKGA